MAKGRRRQTILASKAERKAARMAKPGGQSNYAQKKAWLAHHARCPITCHPFAPGGMDIAAPKPWRKG